jgi:hypothetical protein
VHRTTAQEYASRCAGGEHGQSDKDKEARIRNALLDGDLGAARKAVNGGHHGLTEFSEAYRIGDALLG